MRLCRPAPQHEKNEPITITHEEGQASVETTRVLLTEPPYLLQKQACKNMKKQEECITCENCDCRSYLNGFIKHFCNPLLLHIIIIITK